MKDLEIGRGEIAGRCLSGACPDCGEILPPGAPWSFPKNCPECGMTLRRHDGFFLGALVWNYGLIVFGVLPWVVAAWRLGMISSRTTILLASLAGLVLPPLFYRTSWRLWLTTYYLTFPDQLPGNARGRPQDIDD